MQAEPAVELGSIVGGDADLAQVRSLIPRVGNGNRPTPRMIHQGSL
jgi:hypothetical protein